MCNQTMGLQETNNSFDSESLSEDEHDDYCVKGGSSLEDTLSLTCDESSSMSSSSSSIVDNDNDPSDNEIDIYESPHLLRRRLLPLAPSPITPQVFLDSPLQRQPLANKVSWKRRPPIRMLGLTLSLAWTVYVLSMSTSVRWMREPFPFSPDTQEWRRFLRRRAPKILHKLPAQSSSREYTIRIRGHRVDLITQSLDFHSSCPSVKEVQVEWTDQKSKLPPSLLGHKSGKVKPFRKTSTAGVFLLDENLILSCQDIEKAFQQWRLDPARMVGFYPFHHHTESKASEFHMRPVSRGASYSMVSDRAVFIHNHILRSIPKAPQECQHLGMSIIVSAMTSKPPVVVLAKPQTFQTNRKRKISKHVNQACEQWIESIGAADLPNEIATIVGI